MERKPENQKGDGMKGGYRVGSGPRKGAKYKTRSLKNVPEQEDTPKEKEEIRLMLSFGERLMDGGKLTRTESKQLDEMGKRFGKLSRAEKRWRDEMLESFK